MAKWTRVSDPEGRPLDLLHTRIARRHYAPHAHEAFAVGVCLEGVELIRYRGERHYSGPGTIIVVEPGEAHTGGPATPGGFTYRALYPHAALFAEGTTRHAHFAAPVIEDAELADGLRLAHLALSTGADPLEAETRLSWILGGLIRRHAAGFAERAGAVTADRRITGRVQTWLADRMVDPPGLAEVAGDLGLSRYQVVRAFRRSTGMPPYAWLAQLRVERARVLLEQGWRPADVAPLVGFADQAHLTRWFRRVLGVTPGVFRNSVQDSVRRRP